MTKSSEELTQLVATLRTAPDQLNAELAKVGAKTLMETAEKVGKAWSRSWIGHHANVYYRGLEPPPAGAHFSSEWGLDAPMYHAGTTGDWVEYSSDDVQAEIHRQAGTSDLTLAHELFKSARRVFNNAKDGVVSVLSVEAPNDGYLERLLKEAEAVKPPTPADFVEVMRPSGQFASRDAVAIHQGIWTPPHIAVLAEVVPMLAFGEACERLAGVAEKSAAHLGRVSRTRDRAARMGTNVFIGHGRSLQWKVLKDFIQDRLQLPWDEFNRVPIAGVTNIARLSEMLDAAAVAFIIMTAEDERADGALQARMNVIHEVGLFQGRLGFTKAIVVLEDGCEEFSNIQGVGQIRFPQQNIAAAFEEVRAVLEREGVLST